MSELTTEAAPRGGAALREGVVVSGKYRLVGELGVGAMGVVWSATHQTLGHQVAIKFLVNSVMSSEEARARFEREARLAARLGEASRHITRVIDHGVLDDRVPFLVMELLRGESLSVMLKREKRIPLPLAARIVQQLARALYVAHSAGVIHRDLKPANIFLCTPEQGEEVDVKLLDFGVAKATSETDDEHATGQNQILGTPGYMSPEQVLNERSIDARSDLWAVAAIVYKMVVGRSPFGGGALTEIGIRIMSAEPVPPSQIWPDLPIELDMWMQRGLAKKPSERFQSARELADFLATIAGISTSTTTVAGSISAAAVQQRILEAGNEESSPHLRTTTGSQVQSTPPPGLRSKRPWVVPAAIGAALVLLIVIIAATRSGTTPATASPTQSAEPIAPPAPSPAPSVVTTADPLPSASAPTIAASSKPAPSATTTAPAATTTSTAKTKTKSKDGSGWGNKNEL